MTIPSKKKKIILDIVKIEFVNEDILQLFYVVHRFMVKHNEMSKKNSDEFIKKYKNIPSILHTDPVCIYKGFTIGRVIEIERRNEPCYYRLVVEDKMI